MGKQGDRRSIADGIKVATVETMNWVQHDCLRSCGDRKEDFDWSGNSVESKDGKHQTT